MIHQSLGVCYYPEHWPETRWAEDAGMMRNIGLTFVRVGEFAWSRLEPRPRLYNFEWLGGAIDILHAAGLKVVLGTPTATPPKWLVDKMPPTWSHWIRQGARAFRLPPLLLQP
jgi:beta-galactosidase